MLFFHSSPLFMLFSFTSIRPDQGYFSLSLGCVFKTSLHFCVAAFGLLSAVLCHVEMCFSKQVEAFILLRITKASSVSSAVPCLSMDPFLL